MSDQKFNVRQGKIYYADFPETVGSVQKGIRPVVITQNNFLNRNSTTYVCICLCSGYQSAQTTEPAEACTASETERTSEAVHGHGRTASDGGSEAAPELPLQSRLVNIPGDPPCTSAL